MALTAYLTVTAPPLDNSERYIDLDNFILSRLMADDQHGFTILFNAYYKLMLGVIRHHVHDPDAADDVLQKLLINIWNKRHTLNLPSPLAPYLVASSLNAARNYLRNKGRAKENVASETQVPLFDSLQDNVPADSAVMLDDIDALVALAMQKMSPRVRYTYTLVRNKGMMYAEAAAALGLSVKAVEKHMGIALKVLRTVFSTHFKTIVIVSAWVNAG